MDKSVSIIIASCNRRALLQENLEAIKRQKFKGNLEIIVIDDGSTDGTDQLLKEKTISKNKFPLRYFKSPQLGPGGARNIGIFHSRGEILIFLDDDAVIQGEDYVKEIVKTFQEKDVGIVAGKTVDFYSGIFKLIRAGNPPEIDFNCPDKLKKTTGVPTKNAAFLREAVQRVGGFSKLLKYAWGEDIDLCIKVSKLGYKIAFNEKALVYHYPIANFKGYIKKSYLIGFSQGVFYFLYPDKNNKFSLFKFFIFPLLAVRNFIKKLKICFNKKLFSKAIFKEITIMFVWIIVSYGALYFGKINYLIKKIFFFIKIILKSIYDFNKYFLELIKYFIKTKILPQRRSFIFYLTNRCNLRCKHCFFSESVNKDVVEPTLEEIKKLAKDYYRNTNTWKFLARGISQGFTGGEPFLRDDLLEIIMLFKKQGVKYFQINTNGVLTDKIVVFSREMLKRKISFKIIISIDGLEKTHDKIRNVTGAFKKSIKTIRKLKNIGVKVGVITTINRLNYKEIREVISFLNKNFGIEPGLQIIRGVIQSNAPMEFREIANPLEKSILIKKDIIPEIRNIIFKIYLKKAIEKPFRVAEFARKMTYLYCHLDILEKRKKMFNCLAGKSTGVIYQNGDVSLCEFYKPIGNLKNVGFNLSILWKNKEAQRQRAFIKKCFCHHDCFINTEYNLRFTGYFLGNLRKFINLILRNSKLD
ncbi:glycosyltransferase [Candidatus Wolfebacteria bacterium]|nr:glycosyltransferase [Candidatus Wolfebacteria bacterium]